MYSPLLAIHSTVRWFLFLAIVAVTIRSWYGKSRACTYTSTDKLFATITLLLAYLQLIIGLTLYFYSPLIEYFYSNLSTSIHERAVRFFGMEHSSMMFVSILLLNIGFHKSNRKQSDLEKFKTMAIWFSVALFIIVVNIPWPFSPFAARPWFRF